MCVWCLSCPKRGGGGYPLILTLQGFAPLLASLVAHMVKNLPAMQETQVWFLGWEDALEKGNGNPLQYTCLENPMDREAWWVRVHRVAKSQTRPKEFSTHTWFCHDYYLGYCHDYYLKRFTRVKHWLFILFLLLLSFQRGNRRLIRYVLTGTHLYLVSEMLTVVKYPAWSLLLCTWWNASRRPVANI